MSALVTNQAPMRPKIFSGSPKKNAAWLSFSNTNGGISPGFVSTCHSTNKTTSRPTCQTRRLRSFGFSDFHMGSRPVGAVKEHAGVVVSGLGSELLPIALQDFLAQHRPDRLVQFDEARGRADFG